MEILSRLNVFSPFVSAVLKPPIAATRTLTLSAVATARKLRGVRATTTLRLRSSAGPRRPEVIVQEAYRGAIPLGRPLGLVVPTLTAGGSPTWPTAPGPEARVYRVDAAALVDVVAPSRVAGARDVGVFAAPAAPGRAYSPARHLALSRYFAGGAGLTQADIYEVVPGGDGLGTVISAYALHRPETIRVIAQASSGRLLVGHGPIVGG